MRTCGWKGETRVVMVLRKTSDTHVVFCIIMLTRVDAEVIDVL